MAENVRTELKRRGVDKEIVSSDGTCVVHEEFHSGTDRRGPRALPRAQGRGAIPNAHRRSPPPPISSAATGAMMKYVRNTSPPTSSC